nr:hypothetical protein [Tanacetum cinerariifolium]
PPEKLTGVEPDSGPKTIKSILKSKSTFKAETLKGFIMNEPPSAPARGNKSSSAFKTNSAPAEAWLNSSNKVNQCISEQIPTQKKKILGIDQLTKDTSSSGPKVSVFVKSSVDNSEVSITSSNKPKLFEAKDSTLSNHDIADESLVCSTPFLHRRS